MDIFYKLIEKTDSFIEFSTFYKDCILSLVDKGDLFINPMFIFDHLFNVLKLIRNKFDDISEISYFMYKDVIIFRINIY